jgi:quercetin dioxygenase-like cupin family protein
MTTIRLNPLFAFGLCLTLLGVSCTHRQQTNRQGGLIFPKGEPITNSNFVGRAWLTNLVTADSVNQNSVGSVTFEPGARTNWHSHPNGQIIVALEGQGYYQEKGSPKIILRKGDVAKCPANVPHWHGASPDQKFIQMAITGREKGETVWLGLVSEEEYRK